MSNCIVCKEKLNWRQSFVNWLNAPEKENEPCDKCGNMIFSQKLRKEDQMRIEKVKKYLREKKQ